MATAETDPRAARALDALYREHASAVYRYAYAMLGNRADAEDVMQTVFVNALRAIERGERPRKPTNWLITIAHNLVRQRFRQERTHPAEVQLDTDLEAPGAAPVGEPSLEELVKALQRIPASQREALVMRELEGRSYKEIRELLGVSERALETLLFRARRSVAEELENLVTCDRAELAISRHADARLSRKEIRRLRAHVGECPSCARVAATQTRRRRAFKNLSLLPLPLPLVLFRGAPDASAAAGVSTIGTAATVGASAATGSAGGLLAGGVAGKVAVAVTAVAVASGAGYEGAKQLREAPPRTVAATRPSSAGPTQRVAVASVATARPSTRLELPAPRIAKRPNKESTSAARSAKRSKAERKPTLPSADTRSDVALPKTQKVARPAHVHAKPERPANAERKEAKRTVPKAHQVGKAISPEAKRSKLPKSPPAKPEKPVADAALPGPDKVKPEPEPRGPKPDS
jgi:RNA polymerase sigma factor (sigma-70 family)